MPYSLCCSIKLSFLFLVFPIVTFAQGIDDSSFFSSSAHTLVDFETDGSGMPVVLGERATLNLASSEYATLGVIFDIGVQWVNDGGENFDTAQAIGGSPDNAIRAANGDFTIHFADKVNAFGFWVVHNNTTGESPPTFDALDADGNLISSTTFANNYIDGNIGGVADYGFMGISSSTPISSVQIEIMPAQLDDLRFISVPEPNSFAAIMLLQFGLFLRRKKPSRGCKAAG